MRLQIISPRYDESNPTSAQALFVFLERNQLKQQRKESRQVQDNVFLPQKMVNCPSCLPKDPMTSSDLNGVMLGSMFAVFILLVERFSYDLETKTREQNRNNKRTEIERFDWFIERIQTLGEKSSFPRFF